MPAIANKKVANKWVFGCTKKPTTPPAVKTVNEVGLWDRSDLFTPHNYSLTFFTSWSSPNLGHNMIPRLECSEVIVSKCMDIPEHISNCYMVEVLRSAVKNMTNNLPSGHSILPEWNIITGCLTMHYLIWSYKKLWFDPGETTTIPRVSVHNTGIVAVLLLSELQAWVIIWLGLYQPDVRSWKGSPGCRVSCPVSLSCPESTGPWAI